MASSLPPLPAQFKQVQHYLKTAQEHDARDPVIAYYCRLYSLQKAMSIDKKSPEARTFLISMMDFLEKMKQENKENESIQNEVVGQAHMEEYGLKVFLYADNEDRSGRFGKNVVKSFYTAAMVFDVCTNFGELSEDVEKTRKYARFKAAYIHNCLKNGETPVSGPLDEEGEGSLQPGAVGGIGFSNVNQPEQPSIPRVNEPGPSSHPGYPTGGATGGYPTPSMGSHAPPTTPNDPPATTPAPVSVPAQPPQRYQPPAQAAGVELKEEDYQRAMKLCKFANSALQYEDKSTAVENLTKALNLLTTGHE